MLEMLESVAPLLPHAWIAGDDELGRSSWFRQELRSRNECYLLAVPSNTLVRDLTVPDPPYSWSRACVRRFLSSGSIAGVRDCRRKPGRRSRCAMVRKGLW